MSVANEFVPSLVHSWTGEEKIKDPSSNASQRSSFPSIVENFFTDLSLREDLHRKYVAEKSLPRSSIFHFKQGQSQVVVTSQVRASLDVDDGDDDGDDDEQCRSEHRFPLTLALSSHVQPNEARRRVTHLARRRRSTSLASVCTARFCLTVFVEIGRASCRERVLNLV